MSDLFLSFILAIIQGLTEFLPISSSAHLLLPSLLFGLKDLGLSYDIAVHSGTLVAVIYFFKSEIILMTKSFYVNNNDLNKYKTLAMFLIAATIPIVLVGFSASDLLNQRIFGIQSIALVNIIFAGILLLAFLKREEKKDLYQLSLYGALFIGIFQCFALIPGASRSGTAITAALLIGMNIKDATKFSFMLGIPTILGALVLLLIDIQKLDIAFNITYLIVGFLVSMIFAFLTIKLFLAFVEKIGMLPFIVYRLFLGLFLLLII